MDDKLRHLRSLSTASLRTHVDDKRPWGCRKSVQQRQQHNQIFVLKRSQNLLGIPKGGNSLNGKIQKSCWIEKTTTCQVDFGRCEVNFWFLWHSHRSPFRCWKKKKKKKLKERSRSASFLFQYNISYGFTLCDDDLVVNDSMRKLIRVETEYEKKSQWIFLSDWICFFFRNCKQISTSSQLINLPASVYFDTLAWV